MSKKTKIWLITAGSLILVGCIIFGGVMTMFDWDFTKLSTAKYETNSYNINEDYTDISITTDTAQIVLVPSKNEESSVVCYEQKNIKHSVKVENGTLLIEVVDTRKWYEYIGINFRTPKITVSIPQGEYGKLLINGKTGDVKTHKDFKFESIDISISTGDVKNYSDAAQSVKIKTSTGDIGVERISASTLDLSVSTGKVTVSDVECKTLTSSGNTGDITLKNVIATERFSIERSTGDVKLNSCDAAEILVQTDTGDVTGSLLTDKVFITGTDTGSIDVPKTTSGGKCEITTDTGDIKITVN